MFIVFKIIIIVVVFVGGVDVDAVKCILKVTESFDCLVVKHRVNETESKLDCRELKVWIANNHEKSRARKKITLHKSCRNIANYL